MLAAWRLQKAKAMKVLFHPLLPDGRKGIDFWKIPKSRQSVLLIRMACRLRRVYSMVEMAFIREIVRTWRKTFLSANFSTTNLTWTGPKSNPRLLGKRLVTNSLLLLVFYWYHPIILTPRMYSYVKHVGTCNYTHMLQYYRRPK